MTSSPGPSARRLGRAGFALLALGAAGGGLADRILWSNQAEWRAALPWWLVGLLLPLAGAVLLDLVALKLPAVVAGVLTVLGVYFLGRLLFGTAVGLVAALFMAFARWPLHMSRWGWNETGPPVRHVWAVYFLVRGTRSRHLTDFVLGGLLLGLGMYTYLSIRLALVAIAAYLVYRVVVEHRARRRQSGALSRECPPLPADVQRGGRPQPTPQPARPADAGPHHGRASCAYRGPCPGPGTSTPLGPAPAVNPGRPPGRRALQAHRGPPGLSHPRCDARRGAALR